MRFQILSALTAVLSASTAAAVLEPSTIVMAINKITDLSSDTIDIAQDIQNPFTAIPNGIKLVNNFKDIVTTATSSFTMLNNMDEEPDFPESGQTDICEGFREFVRVHQRLLMIVIGKKSIFAGLPVTGLIAAVLRALETIVDKLAFTIIDLVPTCAGGARADLMKLDGTIAEAIMAYS